MPELAAPQVVRGFAKAMSPAQILDRQTGFRLTQKADDLFFGEALLHVQSPLVGSGLQVGLLLNIGGTSSAL